MHFANPASVSLVTLATLVLSSSLQHKMEELPKHYLSRGDRMRKSHPHYLSINTESDPQEIKSCPAIQCNYCKDFDTANVTYSDVHPWNNMPWGCAVLDHRRRLDFDLHDGSNCKTSTCTCLVSANYDQRISRQIYIMILWCISLRSTYFSPAHLNARVV